jgi:hypothetical protein
MADGRDETIILGTARNFFVHQFVGTGGRLFAVGDGESNALAFGDKDVVFPVGTDLGRFAVDLNTSTPCTSLDSNGGCHDILHRRGIATIRH